MVWPIVINDVEVEAESEAKVTEAEAVENNRFHFPRIVQGFFQKYFNILQIISNYTQ